MDPTQLIDTLRPLLAGALVATDFDGTLAPLVPDPEDSRPDAAAIPALSALAARGARIAVITGRDARTVVRLGGLDAVPGIVVAGLYGLETWTAGQLHTPDEPPQIRALRARLPGTVTGADPAVWIEDKRLSLVVHARRATDPVAALAAVRGQVQALATELGLEVHPGSSVLEVRVPGFDKATALRRLAGDRGAVLFLGDDLGDLPAIAEIRQLRAAGRPAWSVGVLGSRVPEIAAAVDLTVPDAAAAARLLEALAQE